MLFRELYGVLRYSVLVVKIGKKRFEYGIFSHEAENRPYITELFSREVLEVVGVDEQTIFVRLGVKKDVSI